MYSWVMAVEGRRSDISGPCHQLLVRTRQQTLDTYRMFGIPATGQLVHASNILVRHDVIARRGRRSQVGRRGVCLVCEVVVGS